MIKTKLNILEQKFIRIHIIIFNLILAFVCVVLSARVNVKEGLKLLPLLPFAFSISFIIFNRAYSYWKDNIALTILFATIYVRYLITPALIGITNTCLSTVNPSDSSFRNAILLQIYELFITLFAIDYLWTKHLHKKKNKTRNEKIALSENYATFNLSFWGLGFIVLLIALIVVRGRFSSVISHYSTWWSVSEATSVLDTYDLMAIDVVKSVLTVFIISCFAKAYHKTKNTTSRFIYLFLSIAVGLCSTMFYQYTQRTALAQLILSVMIMLIAFFPNKKKLFVIIFGVGGMIFLFYVFTKGSMQLDLGSSNDDFLESLTKMAELYVSGPTMVAITQQNYGWVASQMSLNTLFSDIINTTHIFGLFPFLRGIHNLVAEIPTSNQLFVESLGGLTYILPNISFWTYYFTPAFGWIACGVAIFITVKFICICDEHKEKSNNAFLYYAIAYTEILLGQAFFINNTFLLWHAFTNMPFWLLVFSYVNSLGGRIRKKRSEKLLGENKSDFM